MLRSLARALGAAQGGLLSLASWCLAHRTATLWIGALVVLVVGSGALHLGIRTDGRSLLVPNHDILPKDQEIRQHFHVDDPFLVVVKHTSGSIFEPRATQLLEQLTTLLGEWPEVDQDSIFSLATESYATPDQDSLRFPKLLDGAPTEHDPALLQSYVEGVGLYQGTLVSLDGSSGAIFFTLRPEIASRKETIRKLEAELEAYRHPSFDIFLTGAPVAETLLGEHIARNFALFLPFAITLISIIVWLSFGSGRFVAISLANILAANAFVFGLVGLTVGAIEITTSVLPVFIAFVATVDDIHIFNRVTSGETAHLRQDQAIRAALRRLVRPILLTSLTTCVGFLAFISSAIGPIRNFGVFAAVGTLFCLIWSFTFTPAALSFVKRAPRGGRARRLAHGALHGLRWLARRRGAVWLIVFAVAALMAGLLRLEVQDGWQQGFSADSPIARGFDEVNHNFLGSHMLFVQLLSPTESRPFGTPEVFRQIGSLEAYAASLEGVGGVGGPHRYLSGIAEALGRSRWAEEPAGGDVERLIVYLDLALGKYRRTQILDEDLDRAMLTVFLRESDYRNAVRIMDSIHRFSERHLGLQVEFAGSMAVGRVVIREIVQSLVLAALTAPILCALLIAAAYGSLRLGVLACMPTLLSVICVLGLMGWFDIPLGIATSVYLAVTLGVGVDFAVHLLNWIKSPEEIRPALQWDEMLAVGSAILFDTCAVVGCVLVLTLSQVPATYRLGWLVAISVVLACGFSLFGGCLLSVHRDRRIRAGEPRITRLVRSNR